MAGKEARVEITFLRLMAAFVMTMLVTGVLAQLAGLLLRLLLELLLILLMQSVYFLRVRVDKVGVGVQL